MILLDVTCHAREHSTAGGRRSRGCVCPAESAEPQAAPKRRRERNRHIPGRLHNRRGPRSSTVGFDDIDEVAVERALSGDRAIVLAATERWAAIDRLDRHGLSAREVAIRLGVSNRTVNRRRTRRRLAGGQ